MQVMHCSNHRKVITLCKTSKIVDLCKFSKLGEIYWPKRITFYISTGREENLKTWTINLSHGQTMVRVYNHRVLLKFCSSRVFSLYIFDSVCKL